MRRFTLFIALLALAACAQVKPADEFQFQTEAERLDAAALADVADAQGTDATADADAAVEVDTADAQSDAAADSVDAVASDDAPDAADSLDVADTVDAEDSVDAADGEDASDSGDVVDPCATLDCADDNPCTTDSCKGGICSHAATSGAACDKDKCNTNGICSAGTCDATAKVDCKDGDDCTLDSCDAATGCQHFGLNNNAACVGDLCLIGQTCKSGLCQGGTAKSCDDGNVCTDDSCATQTGCVHAANSAPCDDGEACTGPDSCAGSKCGGVAKFLDATYGGTGSDALSKVLGVSDGFLLVGTTDSQGAGDSDFWLTRTDLAGKTLWQTTFGGTGVDEATDAAALADGYLILGSTTSSGAGNVDAWLVRTDLNGELLWQQTFGKDLNDPGTALAVGGGQVIIGGSTQTAQGFTDGQLTHVDLSGSATWTATFGSTGEDMLNAVAVLGSGYVAAGSTTSSGAGGSDFWLLRTDAAGGKIWEQTFGGTGEDSAAAVLALPDGFLIGGKTTSKGAGDADAWLVRTDLNGVKLWDKTYGGKAYDDAVQLVVVGDGFALSGTTASTGAGQGEQWLLRTDKFGNKFWGVPYGGAGSDGGSRVAVLTDGFALGGFTTSKGAGSSDGWLLRVDLFGNATCAGSGACIAKTLGQCDDGNACTTDLCDAAHTGCWHAGADGMLCDDTDKCTGNDVCLSKVCKGSALNCDDNNPCTADSCDAEFGCVNEIADGGACGADACTNAGVCTGGTCAGATPISCDDGKPCTDDACAPATGCQNSNNDANTCNDGLACVVNDHCKSGACVGDAQNCDDGNACTDDSCAEPNGCATASVTDGKACSTSVACISNETCTAGACGGGSSKLFETSLGDPAAQDCFNAVASTGDGFVLAGFRSSPAPATDVLLMRADLTGKMLWFKTFPAAGNSFIYDYAVGLAADASGYTVAGNQSGDYRLLRTDLNGQLVYDKTFATPDSEQARSLAATSDGGYAVVGTLVKTTHALYVVKTDASGNMLWNKAFGNLGTDGYVYAALPTANGGIAVVGDVTNASRDTWFALIDASGTQEAFITYNEIGPDSGRAIAASSDGGYIIAGQQNSAMFVMRVNSTGVKQWAKQYATGATGYSTGVLALSDGYVVSGTLDSNKNDARLFRIDLLGNQIWDRTYGGASADDVRGLVAMPDGFALAGITASLGDINGDGWLIRTDAFGNTSCASSGTCVSQTLTSCDDTDPCTADNCGATGCSHAGLPDGTTCGSNKTCVLGMCL